MEVGLSNSEVCFIQSALNLIQRGDDLTVDGKEGHATTEAIRQFQLGHKQKPTGVPSREMMDAMLRELASWNKNRNWVHPDD
jgi:peptidoglycan hydrolase-like protein with peptidoglycan-binding domain